MAIRSFSRKLAINPEVDVFIPNPSSLPFDLAEWNKARRDPGPVDCFPVSRRKAGRKSLRIRWSTNSWPITSKSRLFPGVTTIPAISSFLLLTGAEDPLIHPVVPSAKISYILMAIRSIPRRARFLLCLGTSTFRRVSPPAGHNGYYAINVMKLGGGEGSGACGTACALLHIRRT